MILKSLKRETYWWKISWYIYVVILYTWLNANSMKFMSLFIHLLWQTSNIRELIIRFHILKIHVALHIFFLKIDVANGIPRCFCFIKASLSPWSYVFIYLYSEIGAKKTSFAYSSYANLQLPENGTSTLQDPAE